LESAKVISGGWVLNIIRINLKEKGVIPSALLEDLLSIHPAIDVDSGHITCHYTTLSLLVAETEKGSVPLIAVNECILLTAGEHSVAKLVEVAGPALDEAIVKPQGIVKVGLTQVYNPDVVELLLSNTGLNMEFHEVQIEGVGGGVLVVVKQEKGDPIAVIAIPCKKEKEKREQALHY
jgi:hypothetical protein